MYISIRRYKSTSNAELTRRVKDGFLPLISKAPGLLAYYAVESGPDVWASVSVFETKEQAEHSNRLAAEWAPTNVIALCGTPEITAGEVVAHKTA